MSVSVRAECAFLRRLVIQMEEVCEVQSDKAAVEITSRYTGKIVKLYAKVRFADAVSMNLCVIEWRCSRLPVSRYDDTMKTMKSCWLVVVGR